MTAWRQVIELSISDEDVAKLMAIARSRTVPASLVERARIGYVHDQSAIYAFRVCELVGPSEIADVAAIRCDGRSSIMLVTSLTSTQICLARAVAVNRDRGASRDAFPPTPRINSSSAHS
jgi:hypothetical protein